ncbi:hypothetical protein EV194_105293 [Natronoflexus pectinivorans]|uniref:Uncharacterized protein n=1 Tax=Natronoflexus pectinivorans TaxID=682526 RepID=A0A4R2GJI0_9BACT|nr:hypothetical protein EV194_105293 [Natronoflexus pectinivorans]
MIKSSAIANSISFVSFSLANGQYDPTDSLTVFKKIKYHRTKRQKSMYFK